MKSRAYYYLPKDITSKTEVIFPTTLCVVISTFHTVKPSSILYLIDLAILM